MFAFATKIMENADTFGDKELRQNFATRIHTAMVSDEPHGLNKLSMKYEWRFLSNRVLTFRLIPKWELQRMVRDVESAWKHAEWFRNKMISEFDADIPLVDDHVEFKNKMRWFLRDWSRTSAHYKVMDQDGGRKGSRIRARTALGRDRAKAIFDHYSAMAESFWTFKDGKTHNLETKNFDRTNRQGMYARNAYFKFRKTWFRIFRNFRKLNTYSTRRMYQ